MEGRRGINLGTNDGHMEMTTRQSARSENAGKGSGAASIGRGFHPVDLAIFMKALVLARRAQRVGSRPLPQVVAEMMRSGGGPLTISTERMNRATVRATSRWARWGGGRDTCLVRSLVLGALLFNRGRTVLTIGFRPGEHPADPDGHAWLTLDGKPVGSDSTLVAGEYARLLELPFAEPGVIA